MGDTSRNGEPYFMPMPIPEGARGQATYRFNYYPCYECHQFDCGIAEHDGGSRPM